MAHAVKLYGAVCHQTHHEYISALPLFMSQQQSLLCFWRQLAKRPGTSSLIVVAHNQAGSVTMVWAAFKQVKPCKLFPGITQK